MRMTEIIEVNSAFCLETQTCRTLATLSTCYDKSTLKRPKRNAKRSVNSRLRMPKPIRRIKAAHTSHWSCPAKYPRRFEHRLAFPAFARRSGELRRTQSV